MARLNFYRTIDRIQRAGKLGQHIISGKVDHPPPVGVHKSCQFGTICRQGSNRTQLIFSHQSAVAGNISAHQCRQPVFEITVAHIKVLIQY
jgi:hypothetical protein